MICRSCLRRASTRRLQPSTYRSFSLTLSAREPELTARETPPAATSTGVAQPFSNPLTPAPSTVSLGAGPKSKPKVTALPLSIAAAGTPLQGLNYIKGREDPVALPESEYPEWLWKCLEKKETANDGEEGVGDEFSKSKKLRRKAAKRQRKLEERLAAMGDTEALAPKIPITQQSVDLPANEDASVEGAMEAERVREGLKVAMRKERRKSIKEANFLRAM